MSDHPDTSAEAVDRMCCAAHFADSEAGIPEMVATLRALVAERDSLQRNMAKAVSAIAFEASRAGRAEGRLEASELAGVVEGWKARAEAAEAQLRDPLSDPRVKALVEALETLCNWIEGDLGCELPFDARTALAALEKKKDT